MEPAPLLLLFMEVLCTAAFVGFVVVAIAATAWLLMVMRDR